MYKTITSHSILIIRWWNSFNILWFRGRPYIVYFTDFSECSAITKDNHYQFYMPAFSYWRTYRSGTRERCVRDIGIDIRHDYYYLKWYQFFYWPLTKSGVQAKRFN